MEHPRGRLCADAGSAARAQARSAVQVPEGEFSRRQRAHAPLRFRTCHSQPQPRRAWTRPRCKTALCLSASQALTSLLGEDITLEGLEGIFTMLQSETLVMQVALDLLEVFLAALFPEMVGLLNAIGMPAARSFGTAMGAGAAVGASAPVSRTPTPPPDTGGSGRPTAATPPSEQRGPRQGPDGARL